MDTSATWWGDVALSHSNGWLRPERDGNLYCRPGGLPEAGLFTTTPLNFTAHSALVRNVAAGGPHSCLRMTRSGVGGVSCDGDAISGASRITLVATSSTSALGGLTWLQFSDSSLAAFDSLTGALVSQPREDTELDHAAFRFIQDPVIGMLTPSEALARWHGKRVCLWHPKQLWMCAHEPGIFDRGAVHTGVKALGQWEQFTLEVLSAADGIISLVSCHGYAVSTNPSSGAVTATAKERGVWERLHLLAGENGRVVLRTEHAEYPYLSAMGGTMDTSASVGPSEQFYLLDAGIATKLWTNSSPAAKRVGGAGVGGARRGDAASSL